MGYASGGYIRPNGEPVKTKLVIVVPAWMLNRYGREHLEALAGPSVDIIEAQALTDLGDDNA